MHNLNIYVFFIFMYDLTYKQFMQIIIKMHFMKVKIAKLLLNVR